MGSQPLLEFLETAPLKWEATVNATFKKKEEIFPLQTAEMDKIKEQVRLCVRVRVGLPRL